MDLKPCPMCGAPLSKKNISFYDDEGNEMSGASDYFVRCAVIGCGCGYAFSVEIERLYDEEEDLYEGGKWEENFANLANRRYKEKIE